MPAKKGFNFLYPLVICIVIILALVATTFNLNSSAEELRQKAAQAEKKVDAEKTRRKDLLAEIWELRELVHGDAQNAVSTEAIRTTHFEDWKDLKVQVTNERGTPVDASARPEYTNLQEIYNEVKEEVRWQSEEIATLRTQVGSVRKDLEEERADKERLRMEKQNQIAELDGKLTQEQNSRQEDNRNKDAQIQRLIDEKGELAQEKEDLRKDFEMKIAELQNIVSEKDKRIKDLVKKQALTLETAEPDGEILHAENEMLIAYIDLGRAHGVTRGLPFNVFQLQKGGRRKHKGRIEVLDVQPEMSSVTIVETADATDPIVKGDFIISPLFSKAEQQIYVLLGEMVNPTYSSQEIKRKIVEAGGRVDEKVTVETDYVVAGKDAELLDEFDKALQLGIRVLREEELLQFLAP